jgi:hypothetical protein
MSENGNSTEIKSDLVIGYPHGGSVRTCFMNSMIAFREYDLAHKRRLAATIDDRGLYITSVRNKIVAKFLQLPPSAQWLMMIDTDQQFHPWIPYQLLESAEEIGAKVMSALYFGIIDEVVPMWWTTNEQGDFCTVSDIDTGAVQELRGFGAGMFVCHRSVYEAMAERYAKDSWKWFAHDEIPFKGEMVHMGEDLCFCQRLADMGIPMYGDGRVRIGHDKCQLITMETFMKTYVPREPGVAPRETAVDY